MAIRRSRKRSAKRRGRRGQRRFRRDILLRPIDEGQAGNPRGEPLGEPQNRHWHVETTPGNDSDDRRPGGLVGVGAFFDISFFSWITHYYGVERHSPSVTSWPCSARPLYSGSSAQWETSS